MSPRKQPMKDLVVIIPGILGSVLERNGKEIWGLSGEVFLPNLLSLGKQVKTLELPAGVGHNHPEDGVVASRLLPTLHMLPGLWKIDGYSQLIEFLEKKFTLSRPTVEQPGNLIEFPYDWRLSNVFSAKRLSETVVPELERWRKHSGNPEAKLVFICHSMGGLVARWFLEVLGGGELTRMLITIGTPYRGSINALETLVNGFSVGFGWLSVNLDQLVRSLPSAYQLLPTYDCLDVGDGTLQALEGTTLPNLGTQNIGEALSFHDTISKKIADNPPYRTFVIKGILQPTAQSALLEAGKIKSRENLDGIDNGGDGTVPRVSSNPPEWKDDAASAFSAQKHASLQNTAGVLDQLFGILTAVTIQRLMGGVQIGLSLPDIVSVGESLPIEITASDGDETLPLSASCFYEDGRFCQGPILMDSQGDGTYSASFNELAPGAYRIHVESAISERPVDAVSDVTLVWVPSAKELMS